MSHPAEETLARWARGELSEDEEAALIRQAETDPDLQALLPLYRPYSAGENELTVRRFSTSVAATAKREAPRPWVMRNAPALSMVAAAAVAAIALIPTAGNDRPTSTIDLPPYSVEVEGATAAVVRGDNKPAVSDATSSAEPWLLDAPVTLLLRPSIPVDEEIQAAVFVRNVAPASAWVRRDVAIEVANSGAVEVSTQVRSLFLASGRFDLAIVVGSKGRKLAPGLLALEATSSGPMPFRFIRRRVTVVAAQ